MDQNTRRLLKLPEVLHRLPISKSSFYAGIKAGRFPKPIKLGGASVWRDDDIAAIERGEVPQANSGSY